MPLWKMLLSSLVSRKRCCQNDQDCIVAEKKKYQGPTMMVKVHQRDYSERKGVTLNESGEPIGPPSVVTELSSFLGTIAKDPTLVPINIPDWRFMPTKDDIWSYVKEKYHIDDLGKKYVLETVNENWRVHKSRLRKDHFMPYTTDEQRWKKRPKSIPDNQFKDLLEYWNSPVGMELSRINAANRQKYDDVHTLGPRSIASLRYELEKKNPDQPIPDSLVYKESRKRNLKRAYKTDDSKTKEYIAKMDDLQVQIDKGEKDKNVDPFFEVVSKARKGKRILQGKGLKVSSKGKEKKGAYIHDKEFYETMKAEWVEEIMPTLVSKILAELQEAYPQMNLKGKNLQSVPGCSTSHATEEDDPNQEIEDDEEAGDDEEAEDGDVN